MNLSDLTPNFGKNRQKEEENDLGFGTKITGGGERLINRDGSFNIIRTGVSIWTPYQSLVEISWGKFVLLVVTFYVLVNVFFAFLFILAGIENLNAPAGNFIENFASAFFFSIQTFTTVGYGAINPQGVSANIIASIDALVGLMAFAIATGLFFARFSKPKAQIVFSDQALITPYKNITSFQFRIANLRNNKIIDLEAKLTMTWIETIGEGRTRRFHSLELERDKVVLFPLNWTIVHPIDKSSPLYGLGKDDIRKRNVEFLILIEGYDETFAQMVHTNGSYTCREILWDVKFERMYYPEDGYTILELDKIHRTIPLSTPDPDEEEE